MNDQPRFNVVVSYATHATSPRSAAEMFFTAALQPASMVAEVFPDGSDTACAEFSDADLGEIAATGMGNPCGNAPRIICRVTGEDYSPAHHKIAAIRARLNGVWDHPVLMHYGPMSSDLRADLFLILNA